MHITSASKFSPGQSDVAIYAKCAIDHHSSSIERQIGLCKQLAFNEFGKSDYLLFTDCGKSGTKQGLNGIRELIAAIKRGEITDVIVEHFDRLPREVSVKAELASLFKEHNVRLWVASLGRSASQTELVEQAQRDIDHRVRMTYLLSKAIDNLVKSGGMPHGASFGYLESGRPGFPWVCPMASAAIVRLFDLCLTLSDTDTARQLKSEGFISPNGTVEWNRTMVCRLRKQRTFIGIVVHRQTMRVRPADGTRSRVLKRPPEERVHGRNEAFRIVTDDIFNAVQSKRGCLHE